MSMFDAAREAYELGKRLRGQPLTDARELVETVNTWADVFADAGFSEAHIREAAQKLASSGLPITASAIIRQAESMIRPAVFAGYRRESPPATAEQVAAHMAEVRRILAKTV